MKRPNSILLMLCASILFSLAPKAQAQYYDVFWPNLANQLVYGSMLRTPPTQNPYLRDGAPVIVLAHRGITSATHPENSIQSALNVVAHKVEGMELDVYESADYVPYLMHDKTLLRMTGANCHYSDIHRWRREGSPANCPPLNWADIGALHLCQNGQDGHGITVDHPLTPCNYVPGVQVPSLLQTLQAVYGSGYQGLIFLDLREQGNVIDVGAMLYNLQTPANGAFGTWVSGHVVLKFQTTLFNNVYDYWNKLALKYGHGVDPGKIGGSLLVEPVYTSFGVAPLHPTKADWAKSDWVSWKNAFEAVRPSGLGEAVMLIGPEVDLKASGAILNYASDDIFSQIWQEGRSTGVYSPVAECKLANPPTAPSNLTGDQGVYIEGGDCGPIVPPMPGIECGGARVDVFDAYGLGCTDHRSLRPFWYDTARFGIVLTDDPISYINYLASAPGVRPAPGANCVGDCSLGNRPLPNDPNMTTPIVIGPPLPPDFGVILASATSQVMTWSIPLDANGQPDSTITQYQILGGPTSITVNASAVCTTTSCQYTITGLTENVDYSFAVRAISSLGFGALSPFVRVHTPPPSQSYAWRNAATGGGGGFVPGIIFNETEPNLVFARTDIGGAYRLDPVTNKWKPLLDWISADDFNSSGIDSLATDSVNPNRLYMVAGTYTNSWTNRNAVLLRSSDKGNTFQRTQLPFKAGGNMPGRGMGERLAIDPNKNSILFMGARGGQGLWKSSDFGVTWSHVNGLPSTGPYVLDPSNEYSSDPIGVVWVKFDKRTGTAGNATQTIYVGVADKGNSVFRSTNGGATWSAVPGQPTGYLPHKAVLASTGMMYISYSDGPGPYDGSFGAVWKFNTATGAWTDISPQSGTGHYFGFGGLTVDKQNPNTVMVASLNSWWPDLRIWRSLNGGATWSQIWDFTSYPTRIFRYTLDITAAPWLKLTDVVPDPPLVSPKLGWMVESLEIDPFNSNRMMYGTGATLYGTNNLTAWDRGEQVPISVFAAGIEETAVQSILSPPSGAPVFSLMYDVDGFRHTDLNVTPTVSLPKMTTLDFAEYWPNWLVGAGIVDEPSGQPPVLGVLYSENNGVTWKRTSSTPAGATGKGFIAAAPSPNRFLWSDPGAGVNVSTDKGTTWTASNGIPKGAQVVADRVNSMKFYGFYNGTVYASTNGGLNFTIRDSGWPANAKMVAVAGRENHLWLTTNAGLWRSTNGGEAFTQINNVQRATAVGFGKAAAGQNYPAVFVGGKVGDVDGYFRSDDQGASWVRVNDPQHQYATTGKCITGDPRIYGRVYVCTNGRGLVIGDIQ